jgi:hypothetical protein
MAEDANTTQGFCSSAKTVNCLLIMEEDPRAEKRARQTTPIRRNKIHGTLTRLQAPSTIALVFVHEKFKLEKERSISYIFSLNGDNNYQVRKGFDRTSTRDKAIMTTTFLRLNILTSLHFQD